MRVLRNALVAAALLSSPAIAKEATPDDVIKTLPEYTPTTAKLSGTLSAVGSDTLLNLMTFWAEEFRKFHPNVKVQIEGKGSSTAPPALIAGTAQLGPMSREMKSKEIDQFEKKFGFKPTRVKVSLDALGLFVHKDNPVKGLTLDQVDAIFSKNRKLGYPKEVKTWGDLGVTGPIARQSISTFGRNSASGTYGYFKSVALGKGDFKDSVREQPGSAGVVQSVGKDKAAIGYSGMGYRTSETKMIPIGDVESTNYVAPTFPNVVSGEYPLSRFLYIYFVKEPNKPVDPILSEFLTFVQSQQGQKVTLKDGFLPISPAEVEAKVYASK